MARRNFLLNDPDDPQEDYSRNIWGWKFSIFSLVLIVFMSSIMAYRHFVLGETVLKVEKTEAIIGVDTLNLNRE
ncbi:MAG: hypothetical protein NXI23_19290 [Bacteroidetes bacterium]|jgi:hypothetical protein|nr:hypothetical protein [Bacteroidota bacterium]MDF1864480.1 hypothetical protein [Saprospiraceae bacterium]